jgi:glucose-1-phosphate cytidylyltransferase
MKLVILAGGRGTRIGEDTATRPKPLIEIGGHPILWHIMKLYSHYGINDFIICLGYKGHLIKEWFSNYRLLNSDVTIDLKTREVIEHQSNAEPWRITLVDTGENTQTGGRIKRVLPHVGNETFCLTYGDGVADVDIAALLKLHKSSNCRVTLTAVVPPVRFGLLDLKDDRVQRFREKPAIEGEWVNGGFMVVEPGVGNLIDGDDIAWEKEPLEKIAQDGQLAAYRHTGFWHPMDTLRDKLLLESLWASGTPPWRIWK